MVYSKNYNEFELTKERILGKLKEALTMAVENKASRFFLYYTGHGDPDTGGWKTYSKEISLEVTVNLVTIQEILDVVKETRFCPFGSIIHVQNDYAHSIRFDS